MARELEKIQAEYKKTAPALKKTTKAEAEKIKKAMATALEKCWDAEDDLRASLAKAREAGVPCKKLADALKDKDFKARMTVWKSRIAAQKAELDKLMALIASAKSLSVTLAKQDSVAQKLSKSAAKGSVEKKEIDALLASFKKDQAELQAVMAHEGKLKPADKFYAAQFKKIIDKMLSDGPAATSDADLPKLLEEKLLKRNGLRIKALVGAIDDAWKKGQSVVEADAKAALAQLKLGGAKLKELSKLVKDYNRARKSCQKDIKALPKPESKKLLVLLDSFDKAEATGRAKLKDLQDKIKKHATA